LYEASYFDHSFALFYSDALTDFSNNLNKFTTFYKVLNERAAYGAAVSDTKAVITGSNYPWN